MNVGFYQSATSLTSLERWQQAVTANVTSSQTPGFKKRTISFQNALAGGVDGGGSRRASDLQPSLFPASKFGVNFQKGETLPTRREMDLAIDGDGFFQLQNEDGSFLYTRAGEFRMTPEKILVGAGNRPVMDTNGRPIQMLPGTAAVVIDGDGVVSQGGAQIAKIGVYSFERQDGLVPVTSSLFVPGTAGEPEPVAKPSVLQGYLEQANIQPLREMVDLVMISRAYEANQKVIQNNDDILRTTLDKLG
jgi:flagellar basal-body rod protein FlgF